MGNLVSGNNAKSEYNSAYSDRAGKAKSSADIVVLPKKKDKKGTVKKGRVSTNTIKKKTARAAAVSKAVLKKQAGKDKRIRYAFIAILVSIAALIAVSVIIFGSKVDYYSQHFYDNTVINGIDVSGMTLEEAQTAIQHMVNEYALSMTDFEGRTYYVSAPIFGLTYNDDGTLSDLLGGQMSFFWPFRDGTVMDYDIADCLTVNRNSVESWIGSLECSGDAVLPQDAYLTTDQDGFYYIEPEVYGNTVDLEKTADIVENAAKTGETYISMTDDDTYCYLTPSVYSSDPDLLAQMAANNEEVKAAKEIEKKIAELVNLSIVIPGQIQNYTIDSSNLGNWVEFDSKGEPYINTDNTYGWVLSYAEENGLLNSNNLFRTHDGYVVTVDQGPYSGWSFDVAATADQVTNAINTRTSGVVNPVMVSADGISQTSDSYIEISIADQMMWYFENGNVLLETPIVSGNVVADLETPSNGVWAVEYKSTNYPMMAPLEEDGTREYSVVVNYWIPFNNGVGIHDLASRDAFGGDIYIQDGSHGCINTPLDQVAALYDLVNTGTKVVVYGS